MNLPKMPGLTKEGRKFFSDLGKMDEMDIEVGFQEGQTYENGTSLAMIAAYNELGSSTRPARPFFAQTFDRHEQELATACAHVNDVVASGGSLETALKEVGTFVKGLMQDEIVNGGFAPNAPSTIQRKGSAQPLIDTGYMRQSVNFVIKKRGT